MGKNIKKEIEQDLIDGFKVFYSSLYQHQPAAKIDKDVKFYVEEIKELMKFSDEVDLKVKFICEVSPQKTNSTAYMPIQEFMRNGADLDSKTVRFKAVVKAEHFKNGVKYESSDSQPFFKSEAFVIRENDVRFAKLCEEAVAQGKSKAVVLNGQDLQEFSNNKIRFGYTNELGV